MLKALSRSEAEPYELCEYQNPQKTKEEFVMPLKGNKKGQDAPFSGGIGYPHKTQGANMEKSGKHNLPPSKNSVKPKRRPICAVFCPRFRPNLVIPSRGP